MTHAIDRAEIEALRAALDSLLSMPPAVLTLLSALLRPSKATGGNGVDHLPPGGRRARAKSNKRSAATAAAEAALLAALRDRPNAGPAALAKLTSSRTSSTVERLNRLQSRGLVMRGENGWRLGEAAARPT